jgi:hypothetical protein
MPNAVFLSFLGWKQMESYGFLTMNRERLIGRIYGRKFYEFLRSSIMTELRTLWINLGEPRWRIVSGTFCLDF